MLFDPRSMIEDPLPILATVLIIVFGKSLAAFVIVRGLPPPCVDRPHHLGLAGADRRVLVHPGGTRRRLNILPPEARDLILAGAILSIMINPILFSSIDRLRQRLERERRRSGAIVTVADVRPGAGGARAAGQQPAGTVPTHIPAGSVAIEAGEPQTDALVDHLVLVGYGRVGSRIVQRLMMPASFVVIEDADKRVARIRSAAGWRRSSGTP